MKTKLKAVAGGWRRAGETCGTLANTVWEVRHDDAHAAAGSPCQRGLPAVRRAGRLALGRPVFWQIFIAATCSVMTACFAYVGYAVGGLLSVALVRATGGGTPGAEIDIDAAASNLTIQMMLVAAFLVNTAAVFFVGRKHQAGRMLPWSSFALFWAIDTAVPWLYQALFLSPSPAHLALLLGFFPAAIIAVTMRISYRKASGATQ